MAFKTDEEKRAWLEARERDTIGRLLELIDAGRIHDYIAPAMIRRVAGAGVPADSWSLGNRILLELAGSADARTWKAWKREGATGLVDGAEPVWILEPVRRTFETETDSGEKVKRTALVGFKYGKRWRREDVLGELPPIVEAAYAPDEAPNLLDVAHALGCSVDYAPGDGRSGGYYRPATGEIVLHTHEPRVWFHELAHAVHHRVLGRRQGGDRYAFNEVVAETSAATLCEALDQGEADESVAAYVSHWGELVEAPEGREDSAEKSKRLKRVVMGALADVDKVCAHALGVDNG